MNECSSALGTTSLPSSTAVAAMTNGGQVLTLSPTAGDSAGGASDQPGLASSSSAASDLTGDAEGVWSADIDQAFQEALAIYPPCGRRKIIISDEGKMYGRNELIARYIKIRCGKTRTRKQVSSHIQVLARKKARDDAAKKKAEVAACTPPAPVAAPPPPPTTAVPPRVPATVPNFPGIPALPLVDPEKQLKILQSTLAGPYPGLWGSPINPFALPQAMPDIKPFNGMHPFQYQLPPGQLPRLSDIKPPGSPDPGMAVESSNLRLNGFTAYVEGPPGSREDIVSIPSRVSDLEKLKLSDISEKYPKLLLDLYEKGPKDAFYLAKCWANVKFTCDDTNSLFAVDSYYTSNSKFDISVSTKVCSFGLEQVEKDEVYSPLFENEQYSFRLEKSPMCDYMVRFILKLKELENEDWMNNVLENFTVLQVITNKNNGETLMVLCFLFEVNKEPDTTCSLFRLTA